MTVFQIFFFVVVVVLYWKRGLCSKLYTGKKKKKTMENETHPCTALEDICNSQASIIYLFLKFLAW